MNPKNAQALAEIAGKLEGLSLVIQQSNPTARANWAAIEIRKIAVRLKELGKEILGETMGD